MGRWIAAAGAVVVALTIGACSGPDASSPGSETAGAPPALTAEIVQERDDVADGLVRIAITNVSDAEVVVAVAEYRSNQLVEPVVAGDDSHIPAGATRALRGALPASTCVDEPIDDQVVVTLDDGTEIVLDPGDPYDQIPTLTADACVRADVAAIADVEVEAVVPDDAGTPDAPVAAGIRITATPTGEGTLELVDVASTPLLALLDDVGAHAQTLPLGLAVAPSDAPQDVVVGVVPGRCDAHAIAEDKQGTILRIRVLVDGEAATLVLPAPDDVRAALLTYVAEACDLA